MPAFGSYAPKTTRPTLASTIAPAHCAHGSSVTYRVQSFRRSVCNRASACCTASSSAWAVGSRRVTLSLCARTMSVSPRNTAAPTGTSPMDAARRASSSAASIPSRSVAATGRPRIPLPASGIPAFLRTRRLGSRSASDPVERQMVAVLGPIHPDGVALRVLPFQHGHGQWVLQQPLDGPLQRARPVDGVVALRHDQLFCGGRHLEPELPLGHQPLDALELEIHDLRDVLARARPEDDHVVPPVQKLRAEGLPQ